MYLLVVEGSQWERAQYYFLERSQNPIIGLNSIFGLLYSAIGGTSIAFAWVKANRPPAYNGEMTETFLWILFAGLTYFFLDSVIKLRFQSYPREKYRKLWEYIMEQDLKTKNLRDRLTSEEISRFRR